MKTSLNISEEEWEEIEQFLAGKLAPENQENLNNRLSNDKEFSEKISHVRTVITGVREAALESDLKNISLTDKQVSPKKNSGGKRFFIGWMVAAAAVVIVVVLVFSGVFRNSDEKLFSQFYYPDSGLVSSMGTSDKYDFDVAMIDYKSGKYDKAVREMERLRKDDLHNDTLNYFIGNAYLATGETGKAIPYFIEVTKNEKSIFIKDANWYLGLAYLKSGNRPEAVLHISKSENEKKEALLKQITK